MLWCFGSVAVLLMAVALAALTVRPLRLAGQIHPLQLLRGCLALTCLLLALGFIALGMLLPQ